jgi:pimeloyl-ACP methyl ester carboxylesterase
VAKKLHRLLAELHLPPPYVLVGHSWGGPLIRMFAALFPQDVAGMVYVDPTDLRTREQDVEYLLASGYTRDGALQDIKRHRERLARYISSRTGAYRAEMEVIQRNEESFFAEFRSLPAVPEIPVSVLVSGRFDPAMWMKRPCEPKACHDHWLRYRTEWLEALAPKAGREKVTIVAHSGHEIQREAPAVVVASIRRVLSASTQK